MEPEPKPRAGPSREKVRDAEGFRRSLRSFNSFVDSGRRIRPSDPFDLVFRQVVLAAMGTTGASSGAVFRTEPGGKAQLIEAFGPWGTSVARDRVRLSPAVRERLGSSNPVLFPEKSRGNLWRDLLPRAIATDLEPHAVVRLEGAAALSGFVLLGARAGGEPYTEVDRELLSALAGMFSILSDRLAPRAGSPQAGDGDADFPAAGEADEGARAGHPALRRYLGTSPAVRRILSDIHGVAATNCPVLLEGESGTGKELLAQIVHDIACGAAAPFEAISCGAIPDTLIESELFGHVKGSFTGAARDHKGVFERARGGTVFLDEIGEMPLGAQVKLLRVLQEGNYLPVGGERLQVCESRVVAATNRDLQQEAQEGRFRQDLYYRLNVFPIRLPPLRERSEDVRTLIEHFVRRHAEEIGRKPPALRDAALRRLCVYSYPGNVRELQNICRALLVEARSSREITDRHVVSVFSRHRVGGVVPDEPELRSSDPSTSSGPGPEDVGRWVLDELRRYYFNLALAERMLDRRRREATDRRCVPVYSRSGLTYYLQGECFRALLRERFDRDAAARRIAGGDDALDRVGAKLDGFVNSAISVLRRGSGTPEARLARLRRRYSKLPACYEDDLAELSKGFENGRLR